MTLEAIQKLGLWQDYAKQSQESCTNISFSSPDRAVVDFDCHPNLQRMTREEMIAKVEELVMANVTASMQMSINIDLDAGEDGYLTRVKFTERDGRDLTPYTEFLERISDAMRMQIRVPEGSLGMQNGYRINL